MSCIAFAATGPTKVVAPSTSSQRVAVSNMNLGAVQGTALVLNTSNQPIAVAFGDSTVTAAMPTTSTPQPALVIQPGGGMITTAPAGTTHVAVIAEAEAEGNVYITPGYGL